MTVWTVGVPVFPGPRAPKPLVRAICEKGGDRFRVLLLRFAFGSRTTLHTTVVRTRATREREHRVRVASVACAESRAPRLRLSRTRTDGPILGGRSDARDSDTRPDTENLTCTYAFDANGAPTQIPACGDWTGSCPNANPRTPKATSHAPPRSNRPADKAPGRAARAGFNSSSDKHGRKRKLLIGGFSAPQAEPLRVRS
jgi:hypothetical protein